MATQTAVFNEMLSVQVDLNAFETGLREMADMYKRAMSDMSAAGIDTGAVSNTADIGVLSKQISALGEQLTTFMSQFGETFATVTSQIVESLSTATGKTSSAMTTMTASIQEEAEKQTSILKANYQEQYAAFSKLKEMEAADEASAVARMTADEQKAYSSFLLNPSRLQNLAFAGESLGTEESGRTVSRVDPRVRPGEEVQAAQVAALQQAQAMAQKAQAVQDAAIARARTQAQQAADEIEALMTKINEATNKEFAANESAASKSQAAWIKEANAQAEAMQNAARAGAIAMEEARVKEAEAQAAADAKELRDYDNLQQQRAQAFRQSMRQMADEVNQFNRLNGTPDVGGPSPFGGAGLPGVDGEKGGIFSRFAAGFRGDTETSFAEMVGQVARFEVLWGSIGAVMHGIEDVARGIADQFKSGWTYLQNVQESSVSLQGVLVRNVQFGGDMAHQFEQAGIFAQGITQELLKVAADSRLNPTQLQESFRSSLNAGLPVLEQNVGNMIELVKLLSLAIESTGGSSISLRRDFEVLPQLIAGSLDPTNQLYRDLHLNYQEWQKIRSEAEQHHNLLELMQPLLAGLAEQGEKMQNTQVSAFEQLKLTIASIMGDVDKPYFDKWTDSLQRFNNYLTAHKQQIVDDIHGFFSYFTTPQTIPPGLAVKMKAEEDAYKAEDARREKEFGKPTLLDNSVGDTLLKRVWAIMNRNVLDDPRVFGASTDTSIGGVSNLSLPPADLSSLLGSNLQGIPHAAADTSKFPGDETFRALMLDYKNKLADLKAAAEDARQSIRASMADNTTSIAAGSKALEDSFDAEKKSLNQLSSEYEKMGKLTPAAGPVTPTLQSNFLASTAKGATTETSALTSQETSVRDAAAKDQIAIEKAKYDTLLQLARVHAQQLTSLNHSRTSEGLQLKSQEAATDIAIATDLYQKQQQLDMVEYSDAINNVLKRTAAFRQFEVDYQTYTDKVVNLAQQRSEALRQEALQAQLSAFSLAKSQQSVQQASDAVASAMGLNPEQRQRMAIGQAQAQVGLASGNLDVAQAKRDSDLSAGKFGQPLSQDINNVNQALAEFGQAIARLITLMNQPVTTKEKVTAAIFGNDDKGKPIKSLSQLSDASTTATTKLMAMGHAFDTAVGIFNAVKQGYDQGGVAGGIGAGMSAIGGAIPGPVGAALSIGGSVLSFIGDMFTAEAKKIADNVQKAFSQIQSNYSVGAINLSQAIQQEQQEITTAIQSLTGQKGGEEQLDKILPGMQQALAGLQQQQKQLMATFNEQLAALSLGNSQLQSFASSWSQVNAQVTQFIGAGGSVADATKYMSLSLKQLQQAAELTNNSNEQQAVNDALQLNQLLEQRTQLMEQEAKQEFALQNSDALERRLAPGIAAAQAVAQQKEQYNEQLDQLNYQITLQSQKVDMETSFFNIQTNINDLQTLGAQLQKTALDDQLAQWQAIQQIVNGITVGANGQYGLTQAFQNLVGSASNPNVSGQSPFGGINPVTIGTINVTVSGSGATGQDIGNAIISTINTNLRGGAGDGVVTAQRATF